MKSITIGGRSIGDDQPVFIIAEAGANHNGELALAKELATQAKELGCDCIKFQTFTAEEFCADPNQLFTYRSQGVEVTERMIDLFRRLEFKRDQWAELMAWCDQIGIMFLTTVQDPPNLTMMLELGLKGIKVGSDDFDHLGNLGLYADTGLPLIVSKGMATLGEVDRVVNFLRHRTDQFAVLHCVSLYPTAADLINLRQISTLRHLYPEVVWGFSDHSEGTFAAALSVAVGAKIIEKHFTLNRDLPGPDHWFSLDVDQMRRLVQEVRLAEQALGTGRVNPAPAELEYRKLAKRRAVAAKDLPAGAVLTETSVAFRRSSTGIFVSDWDAIAGRRLARSVSRNQGINMADVTFDD